MYTKKNDAIQLRTKVINRLLDHGFFFDDTQNLVPPSLKDKESIRKLHLERRKHILEKDYKWILKNEDKIFTYFANGNEIDFANISPTLIRVESTLHSNIFRYATYLWSIPVSRGYGRNMRYLVIDNSNNKLIGIFALGDPVIGLKARDELIGWDRYQKEDRLWHVMDAYVLGAVPPYNKLLGGKLVASLVVSQEVRADFGRKYGGKKAIISGKTRKGHLVLVTTNTALGKSSMLSRLQFSHEGLKKGTFRYLWEHKGMTSGYGHFHLDNGIADEMISYLKEKGDPIVSMYNFGNGPQWKIRVIKRCLKDLGISDNVIKHGINRGFYVAPLASNYQEFLRGEVDEPEYYNQSANQLIDFFKERYLLPRIERSREEVRAFDKESIRISTQYNALLEIE
jgi:hypothetical protein